MQAGVPYRLWVHLRAAVGKKKPGVLYVQFSDAVDRGGKDVFRMNTAQFLTLRGTERDRWAWVGRDLADARSQEPVLYFRTTGEVSVRVTVGDAGSAFDQLVLSPSRYFEKPPADPVVPKPRK